MFNLAAVTQIIANASVQAYAAFYPDMEIAHRHVFYAYLLVTGICTVTVIFFNRIIPYLQHVGATLVLGGGIATLIVVIAMPKTHATHSFVWADWNNTTGLWDAVAFLTGILSGAFTIGTVDAITHLAEELPNPKKDLPKAIAVQIGMGFLSTY
jgi:amino acid transporter